MTTEKELELRGSAALDQWRGLALWLVLISHGFFFTNRVNGIGRVGVNLFFFISGILVFRSLRLSKVQEPALRTKDFWRRRFRRLYPALLAYVLAMLPVVWLLGNHPGLPPNSDIGSFVRSIPAALFYWINFSQGEPMSLGHLWSLACEMQFYFLAPLLFWLGGTAESRRRLVFLLPLVILMTIGIAHPILQHWNPEAEHWKYQFEFAVWPMMLGFCCEWQRGLFKRLSEQWVTKILWGSYIVLAVVAVLMLLVRDSKPLVIAAGAWLLLPCLLSYLFGRPMPGWFGRSMQWSGERTYSIYLWQQPLTLCGFLPNVLHPVGALLSVGVGAVWFRFFERPFLSSSRKK